MAKSFIVEVTVPEGYAAGDTFKIEVEAPVTERKPRGVLNGIAVEDMTEEQLKRELINANSVLYKAKQRGANAETLAANQARVDAVKAEREKRGLNAPKNVATAKVVTDDDGVYDDDAASEM